MTQLFIKDVINYIEMNSLSKQYFGYIRYRASSRPTGTPFRGGTSVFKTKTAKIENVRAT